MMSATAIRSPIHDLFVKQIDRPIEGVIKADDARHLETEVEEYVLTNESAAAMWDLLEAYTAPGYGGSNGVWISGFFGSGKSHLLKMLAHLLGDVPDQPFPREVVAEQFAAKAEAFDPPDTMLAKKIQMSLTIPATALLFNIDVKAPLIDKGQKDALLQVFVKVFNEARGYYGGDPSVARFERFVDRRGKLDEFKVAFAHLAGMPWEEGREEGPMQDHNVTAAWSQVTGEPPTEDILAWHEERYTLSIEDFADEVRDWLATKPDNYRLLFFVDEVGQFIGANTNLMLNLQSMAEQLNTKCDRRAWLFVTSQEDVEGVIGDRDKWQANDFSKIQARFKTRMKLTSSDVEEVIQKRLLDKTTNAKAALADLYDEESANFGALFTFRDGATQYRNYRGADHFIGVYPFVPYQFPFFQAALVGLSEHNAFEGKNAAVGERSMLVVFQDVVKQLASKQVGALASFDLMYAGIASTIKSAATANIRKADQHLELGPNHALAVRLLKALFLVKYVKGFNATPRNLTVLLYGEFNTNIGELTAQIQAALDELEIQNYVERNNATYSYLTNEEQEVEAEIKGTEVTGGDVSKLLGDIITGDVVKTRAYREPATGADFPLGQMLDERPMGLARPLTVHYISAALGQPREVILAQSMGRDELRVLLADEPKLYADLRLWVQTDKYIRTRLGAPDLTENQRHILDSKHRLNGERRTDLIRRVREAITASELVSNGVMLQSTAADPEARVLDGARQLVARTYSNLGMLGTATFTETGLRGILDTDPALFTDTTSPLHLAAAEMEAFIVGQQNLGQTVTAKRIVENFEAKPYGWPLAAILSAIAYLVATNKIALKADSNILKRTEVSDWLRNGQKRGNVDILKQKQWDPSQVQRLRHFAQEFFAEGGFPDDAIDLAAAVKSRIASDLRVLEEQRRGNAEYPFITLLDEPISLLKEVQGHDNEWYLDEFARYEDGLLAAKEDAINPISAFLSPNSGQRAQYDRARELLIDSKDSLDYLDSELPDKLRDLLADPKTLRGAGMTRLRDTTAELRDELDQLLMVERSRASATIAERELAIQGSRAYSAAPEAARAAARSEVASAECKIVNTTSVPVIRQTADTFDEVTYNKILGDLEAAAQLPVPPCPLAQPSKEHGLPIVLTPPPAPPTKPIISMRSLIKRESRIIESDADADRYIEELRQTLHQAIAEGKRVTL